jgi:hypothetical protein
MMTRTILGVLLLVDSCVSFLVQPSLDCRRLQHHHREECIRLYESADDEGPSPSSSMNETVVTTEMFQRELLADPVVKRKKGRKTDYKVLDNRDSLPFRVEHTVPDPYTHPDVKRKKANKVKRQLNSVEEGLKSSLFLNSGDGSNDDGRTSLGEYNLDKHTTTGDLLEIGDIQYKVVRHKCQYKYAGGKRFVMVRKVLQVKEVGRLQTEEYLKRQWSQSDESSSL